MISVVISTSPYHLDDTNWEENAAKVKRRHQNYVRTFDPTNLMGSIFPAFRSQKTRLGGLGNVYFGNR